MTAQSPAQNPAKDTTRGMPLIKVVKLPELNFINTVF